MKSLIYTFYTIFIILIQIQTSFGQKDQINLNNIRETIHINTDRDLYFNGEIVNFSIDYFINETQPEKILSNIVYVELINCNSKSIIYQEKLLLKDFKSNGSLIIPKDVLSGNYMLRAYTQYQRNFSDYSFGYQFISIINPTEENIQFSSNSTLDSIKIVAESNILLEGTENKIVFQVAEYLHNPENKYYITDSKHQIIKEIKPIHKSYFQELVNLEKGKYFLQIVEPNGKSFYKEFPKVLNEGIQTNTEFLSDYIQYKINLKKQNEPIQNIKYQLNVLSSGFILMHSEEIKMSSQQTIRNISTQELAFGINYLVLIDENGNILKVNPVYKPISFAENLTIELDKERYGPREEISIKINKTNQDKKGLGKLSISVILDGVSKSSPNLNLSNYTQNALVLENILQNKNLQNEELSQLMILLASNLDYNLISEKLAKHKLNILEYLPETRGLTVAGILRNKKGEKPIAGKNVYISALFNNPQLHIYKTRDNGEFIFSLNNLDGINNVFLCTDLKQDENTDPEILIKNSFSQDIPDIGLFPVFVDTMDKKSLEKAYINSQIQNQFYKKEFKEVHKKIKTGQFNIGGKKITKYLDNYVKLENMEVVFTEIFPNIKYNKSKGGYNLNIVDEKGFYLTGNPLVLVDNVPVFDINTIMQMDVSLIEKIDVVYKTYVLGPNIIPGLIHITTKTENFAGIKLPDSSTFMEYHSVNKQVLINEPINTKEVPEEYPDFRTTLYWNPEFELNNNSSINFFSSDRKGTYNVIVKGYNSKGELITGKKQFIIE